jgi:hypothetical protein
MFVPSFDPNEWCLKNGLHSGGLIPGPLGHESSALTTRPWLLALTGILLKACNTFELCMVNLIEPTVLKQF